MLPLHGPGNTMNSCKVMLSQAKAMKSTWLTARGGGAGHMGLQGAKKCPAEGGEQNSIVVNKVK